MQANMFDPQIGGAKAGIRFGHTDSRANEVLRLKSVLDSGRVFLDLGKFLNLRHLIKSCTSFCLNSTVHKEEVARVPNHV
jgi:hypothetical protein